MKIEDRPKVFQGQNEVNIHNSQADLIKLGEICEFIRNGANIKQSPGAKGFPITRIETLSNDKFNLNKLGYADIFDITPYKKYILNHGDILISHINSEKYLGRAIQYRGELSQPIIHGMNLLCIRLLPYAFPSYIEWFFKSDMAHNFIASITKKAVNQASFNITDLKNMPVLLPPLFEQKRIAAILDKVDGLIRKRKASIRLLDELVKSKFVEMFGDPLSSNEKIWPIYKIGDKFSVTSGGTPATSNRQYWSNGNIPWIGSNMCQNNIIYENDGKYITQEGLNNSSAKIIKKDNVLVALVGATIGKVALLKFDTAINQNIAAINVVDSPEFLPEYIFYLIQFLYSKFLEIGSNKFKMANQSFIKNLKLPAPTLDIQKKFNILVNKMEKDKIIIKKYIDTINILKLSLIKDFFKI